MRRSEPASSTLVTSGVAAGWARSASATAGAGAGAAAGGAFVGAHPEALAAAQLVQGGELGEVGSDLVVAPGHHRVPGIGVPASRAILPAGRAGGKAAGGQPSGSDPGSSV